jgi:hypothetical protein
MSDAATEIQYQAKQTRRVVLAGVAFVIAVQCVGFGAVLLYTPTEVAIALEASAGLMLIFGGWMMLSMGSAVLSDGLARRAWNRVPCVDIQPVERDSVGDRP